MQTYLEMNDIQDSIVKLDKKIDDKISEMVK